ncbi:thioredoxin domain-containing protein 5 homolog [Drosophila subobscura]|uniref:thioredoxin domain-containing protein 5 homolog n=1 Tax=Drosophila subobscura TaxID=7241 RepID=UPI00155A4939|nr:thioredoxin domain-containing protein 5 homolog [Drosophila subobscura]
MFARSLVPITVCAFFLSPHLSVTVRAEEEAVKNVEKQFAVELDPEKFNQAIQAGNVFVKFFAPWCGHCKRLHPLWEQLAEIMNVEDPKVIIAKVDCTKHQSLCAEHEVTGYPTLRLFKLGEAESVKFKGTRDLPAITDFINHELSTLSEAEQAEQKLQENAGAGTVPVANQHLGKVVDLSEDTFAKHVSSGNHFVKFFAPWCSHCQRLAPTWDELAKELKQFSGVTISKIDCTQYRSVCQDFEVKGYPTLLWIEDGKKIEKYSGARDLPTLKTYVEKMVGVPTEKKESSDTAAQEAAKEKADEEAEKLKPQQLSGEAAFTQAVAEGTAFIKFYAPWCGHCQKLQPTWEQLATETHNAQSGVVIAKVDCTAPENKQICIDEQVEGYPTLFLYKNGQRQDEYEGSRTLPELKAYLKKTIGHDEL